MSSCFASIKTRLIAGGATFGKDDGEDLWNVVVSTNSPSWGTLVAWSESSDLDPQVGCVVAPRPEIFGSVLAPAPALYAAIQVTPVRAAGEDSTS